jgi:hypothetical protein
MTLAEIATVAAFMASDKASGMTDCRIGVLESAHDPSRAGAASTRFEPKRRTNTCDRMIAVYQHRPHKQQKEVQNQNKTSTVGADDRRLVFIRPHF